MKKLTLYDIIKQKQLPAVTKEALHMGKSFKRNLKKTISIKNIHRKIFLTQFTLIITIALFLGISGTLINIHFEIQKRDQNLQNIAEAVANSPLVDYKIDNPVKNKIGSISNIIFFIVPPFLYYLINIILFFLVIL